MERALGNGTSGASVRSEHTRWQRLTRHLPQGGQLAAEDWNRRHHAVLILLALQAAALAAFGWKQGIEPSHLAIETAVLGLLGVLAAWHRWSTRRRAMAASAALVTTSALLTHYSGGYIEAHFHFFVMLGVIVLYEDWVPFLMSIAYVALHHGIVGTLDPTSVYNHPLAIAHPWWFASIHATFILALSAALVFYWKMTERSRTLTDVVLKSTTSGILGVRPNGIIQFANPAAERMVGQPAHRLVGMRLSEVVARPAEGSPAGAGGATMELRRTDGSSIPIDYAVRDVKERGVVVGQVATFLDASERLRGERELRRFNQQLEHRVKERTAELEQTLAELEAFNASVSHDLRTPLRVIRGFTQLVLNQDDGLGAESRERLRRVEQATGRMSLTIEALMELSRTTRAEVRRQRVDLTLVAHEVVERLRGAQPERRVRFSVAPGLTADADPALAHVVMTNLLSNAWKFTTDRTEAVIEIGALPEAGAPTFFVRDNGIGFSQDEASQLFRPFERLEGGRRFEGTGIGLATVERILTRHGGSIRAVGIPDKGATFIFSFGGSEVERWQVRAPSTGAPAPARAERPLVAP